jgi:plasmid stability protein
MFPHMSVMVQIRNMPDGLHRTLKSRAALAGLSLSDYLLSELAATAELPTHEELWLRLAGRERVELPVSAADLVREARESR